MAVSTRLRFEILRRDGFRCKYCGKAASEVELVVDHVIPSTLGGPDTPDNLVAACKPCNAGKSSVPLDAEIVADVSAAAVRWRAAIVEARYQLASERGYLVDLRASVEAEWNDYQQAYPDLPDLPGDWMLSVEPWWARGLTAWDVKELMEPAVVRVRRDPWKYFCGIVWKRLDQLQERALEVVETDPADWTTQRS